VKRALLVLATAVLFLNTFAFPASTIFDGGGTGTNCGTTGCKP